MATIIISLILLVMTVEQGSSGWYSRFNILGTEAKEQATSLAEGCAEQAMAKLLTDPTYTGGATTTTPAGTCYIFPIQTNFPTIGLLTLQTQGVVKNSYTNLNVVLHKNNISYANTGQISPTNSYSDTGGDNNGFELNPTNAYSDGQSGVSGSAQNINGPGDRHRFNGYNFNIPNNAIINGIQIRLDWWINSVNGSNFIDVELSWDGGLNWTQIKSTTNESTSVSNYSILGAPTDTWGRTWTPTELNSTNFMIRITTRSTVFSRDFYLDWIPVVVNYSIHNADTSSGNFYITPIESWVEIPNIN